MSLRTAYEAKAEADFSGVHTKLSALAQSKHDEALHRFQLLKDARAGGWGAVMIAFESAWAEFRVALQA